MAEWSLMILFLRRLEVLLDRSWEKESITWTGLTWWDPLPCGQDFVVQVLLVWTTRFHKMKEYIYFFSPGDEVSATAPPFSCFLASL